MVNRAMENPLNWVEAFLNPPPLNECEQTLIDGVVYQAGRNQGERWKAEVVAAGKAVIVDNDQPQELPPHRPRD